VALTKQTLVQLASCIENTRRTGAGTDKHTGVVAFTGTKNVRDKRQEPRVANYEAPLGRLSDEVRLAKDGNKRAGARSREEM